MTELRRNIELKAVDPAPARSLAACKSLGAEDRDVLRQRDTYFHTREGRLKLREEVGATAQLIAYERADLSDQRTSHYRLIDVGEPEELRAALATALGVKAVVAKERRLFLWEGNVRIDGLGSFIEFEAVAADGRDLSREETRVATLRQAFEIEEAGLIGASYCELVLAAA